MERDPLGTIILVGGRDPFETIASYGRDPFDSITLFVERDPFET